MIITLADYKSLTNTTGTSDDAFISSLIAPVQNQIEIYCDRLFDAADYKEIHAYNDNIFLEQYPINSVKFVGSLINVAEFSSDDYTYEITSSALNITDDALTTTEFLFATYPTLAQLKVAVEAALPITLDIVSTYTTMSYKLLKPGISSDIYGGSRILANIKITEPRTLEFTHGYINWGDCYQDVLVIYNGGYTVMPKALQLIMSNIISDILAGTKVSGGGLIKSETITNYSVTYANPEMIKNALQKYKTELEPFVKKYV